MDDAVTPLPEGDTTEAGSRRNLLKIAGAAAGGAAIAAVASSAPRASAATNEALVGGAFNFAANITYLRNGAGSRTGAQPVR